jgi:Heterokaryon incompatibility protein (HET)
LDRSFDSFICLSYCWHKEDWSTTTSHGLHEEWPITENMLCAFLAQRSTYDEGVWIDALCIDQNNPTEKMHAIGSMDMLYKSARTVYIILEDIILPEEVCDTMLLLLLENPDLETAHMPNTIVPLVQKSLVLARTPSGRQLGILDSSGGQYPAAESYSFRGTAQNRQHHEGHQHVHD